MNQTSRNAASLLLFVGLSLHGQPFANTPEEAPSVPAVSVRVFNYAGVKQGVFSKARREAARILRRSGIETEWIGCAAPSTGATSDPRCIAKTESTDLVIRILPREMAGFERHSELGVALVPPNGGFGNRASIFHNRMEEYAERWQASEGLLLGHLIAHEMGHLLLGVNSHSRSGIMNVPWTRKKVEKAQLGTLLFTSHEAKKMQAQVTRRMELASDTPTDQSTPRSERDGLRTHGASGTD